MLVQLFIQLSHNDIAENDSIAFGHNFHCVMRYTDLSCSVLSHISFQQWVTKSETLDNDEGTYIILPIAFPTKGITAVLSDTWGRLSNSSAMANQTEGASINAVTTNSVQIINYWSGGLKTNVTVLALGC